MNRKISVFILLILLASSFKYRAKTYESKAQAMEKPVASSQAKSLPAKKDTSFEEFTDRLHKANQELVSGNPEPLKALWSKAEGTTVAIHETREKEWETVSVNLGNKATMAANEYSFENITTQVGTDLACLLQTEHYRRSGEKPVDLQVTILCRKEGNEWKIVHRQAENTK
ncbi:hypothetical protein [Dyadobacter sp. CY312]|uniref:hypothetical protein n=1 Tax=Dyadobacter sp. CY312 TaxID=2907303 RepID=UPI001F216DFE|nr:hypothetical protein [Dyadobacter sp. CY312]MCE7044191.1 hypothetical protein [Dyadobacter sp. CY312]